MSLRRDMHGWPPEAAFFVNGSPAACCFRWSHHFCDILSGGAKFCGETVKKLWRFCEDTWQNLIFMHIEHLFELAALGRKFGAALYGLDSENWRLYAFDPENPESRYTISLDRFEIIWYNYSEYIFLKKFFTKERASRMRRSSRKDGRCQGPPAERRVAILHRHTLLSFRLTLLA